MDSGIGIAIVRAEHCNYNVGIFYSFGTSRVLLLSNKTKTPFRLTTSIDIIDFSPRRSKLNRVIEKSSDGFLLITPSLSCLGENVSKIGSILEKVLYKKAGAIYLVDTNELIDRDSRVSLKALLFKLIKLRQEIRKQKRYPFFPSCNYRRGRPSILDRDIRAKVKSLATQGVSIRRIAKVIGSISKSTVQRIIKEDIA